MTRIEVITKAMEGKIRWIDVAGILGLTERQVRRLKRKAKEHGIEYVVDQRGGRPRRKRVKAEVVEKLCALRRSKNYMEFSVRHFFEHAVQEARA